MKNKENSKSLLVKKHQDRSKSVKVFVGIVLPRCIKKEKKDCLFFDNPYSTSRVGQTYPWQVAPQQSLFPFRFDNAKVSILKEIDKTSTFFPKKVLSLQNKCKIKTGLKLKCKVLLGQSQKNVKFFQDGSLKKSLCNSVFPLCNSV